MTKRKGAGILVLAAGAATGAGAQGNSVPQGTPLPGQAAPSYTRARLGVSALVDGWFPKLVNDGSDVQYAISGSAQLSYAPLPFLEALARAGVHSMQLDSDESILYVGGSAGLGFVARLLERVSVEVSGFAGLGKILNYNGKDYGMYELGARLETSLRLSSALTLGISAGYERLANPNSSASFLDAISAGISLKLSPAELARDRANVAITKVETQAIFPVFRSWYDSEPLGSVTIRNNEDGAVENLSVSFFAPEYMGGPRLCATVGRLERGESTVVPLYAVFDERVLSLTENGKTTAAVDIEYSFLGSRRTTSEGLSLSLHHRNAMSWEDDQRAAAFVSPTDPAALWFSRYSSSVVRDRMRTELPPNLQYALGIFEALKLYGLNYVIDPNSSYIDISENAAVVDYLQYPSQTLMYRGGDCDDLSILYCSLLESTGIDTAFITIPGHIYMAFDLGMTEADAREKFFDPGLLIFRDGQAWAPVEITMVKDGFVKAWRVGAKQWVDNDHIGSAAFYSIKEAWKRYRPSGLQNAAARFDLPDEAKAMTAFDTAVDRFVSRELEPIVAEYEKRLASNRTPETLNDYGMSLAKVGLLDAAWEKFAESAKSNFPWAWNNLASIAFVRKDYKLAYDYYAWTTTLLPGDPVAVLGMARSAYELDRYAESETLYRGLKLEAPSLAEKYGYLASAYGGQGRAWSMADRLSGSVWSKPGMSFEPALPAAAPAIAVVAPQPQPSEVQPATDTGPAPIEAPAQLVEAPQPEPTLAPVTESVPEPVPTPAPVEAPLQVVEAPQPEPAPTPEPAPVSAPVPAPAPVEAPLQVVEPPQLKLQTVKAPTSAPPAVIDKPPEDVEIAAAASTAIALPPAFIPAPPAQSDAAALALLATPTAPTLTTTPPATDAVNTAALAAQLAADAEAAAKAAADIEAAELASIAAQKAAAQAIAAKSAEFTTQPTAATPVTEPAPVVDPAPALVQAQASEPAPVIVSAPVSEPAPVIVPAPVAEPAPVTEPAPVIVQEPAFVPTPVPESAPVVVPAPITQPTYAPKAQFASTAERGGAPAFGKRLPEGADATGYTKIIVNTTKPTPQESQATMIDLSAASIRIPNGNWKRTESTATMTDAKAMYAKLVMEVPEGTGPTSYEFNARSTGTGWVGFGLHVYGRGTWKLKGYGGGDSILVWITSDPKANGDTAPRLQVYRSSNEVDMTLLTSVKIPGSAFDLRTYRIDYNPDTGEIIVFVNGEQRLAYSGPSNPGPTQYAAFRALDLAEFSDLSIRPSSHSGPAAETTP